MLELATQQQIDRQLAIRSLSYFVRHFWPVVEPGTALMWNWHIDIVCNALQRQISGDDEYRKLLICVPPGSMKSLLVSVFAPAWEWLHNPARRKLFLSNDDDLASRDSRRMRELITSQEYAETVKQACREPWDLAADQKEKVNYATTAGGFRMARSIGSKITGKRGDDIVIDDPMDAREVINGSVDQVNNRLLLINNVIEKVLPSRVNNLRNARWTLIMQRLHQDDPAGRIIKEGVWKVINIQMEFEPENSLNNSEDPRKNAGDLMFPALFPSDEIDKLKVRLGTEYYAQYQQRPVPREGGIIKQGYIKRYASPPELSDFLFSWDLTFSASGTSYYVGSVWARSKEVPQHKYLVDLVRAKGDFVEQIAAIKQMASKWPEANRLYIEEAANGYAAIATLKRELARPPVIAVRPKSSKLVRLQAVLPEFEAGNVWIPDRLQARWVDAYEQELLAFPSGQHDDQVDVTTQALERMRSNENEPIQLDLSVGRRVRGNFNPTVSVEKL